MTPVPYVSRLRTLVQDSAPLLLALDEQATAARPSPGKWSPREVIGHLIDSASINHERFVRSQLQDSLVFSGYDQDACVAVQRYGETSWTELVSLWRSLNLHVARVMEAVPDDVRLRRRSEHNLDVIASIAVPSHEATTLDYLMEDYVWHLEHHLKQILGPDLDRGTEHPGAGGRPALLVVDVQEDAVARRPYEGERVIANIAELLAACRAAATPVVYVQHDGKPGEPEEPHTPGWEIHEGIAPVPGEPIFRKRFNSAFRGTELHGHLRDRGIDTLLIVGIQTEYCVDTTVRVAFELGYSVVVPEMTNTTYDNGDVPARAIHEMINARIWDKRFAAVVPLEDALRVVTPGTAS